jgi:hypothetical protein
MRPTASLSALEVDELLDLFTGRPRRAQIPNHLSVRDVQLVERGTPLAEQVVRPIAARAHVLRSLVRQRHRQRRTLRRRILRPVEWVVSLSGRCRWVVAAACALCGTPDEKL